MRKLLSSTTAGIVRPSSNSRSSCSTTLRAIATSSHNHPPIPYAALALFAATTVMATLSKKVRFSDVVGGVYDKVIVHMTELWYQHVLERQKDGAVIMDVGIGTAAALIRCKDIILQKKLRIVGIDYNHYYVEAAQRNIQEANLEGHISVHCFSVYDIDKVKAVCPPTGVVDAVYFSGSFSLLPDPSGALTSVSTLLSSETGKIYITQTYQRRTPPLLSYVKPLIKYLTTIDFGQLVKVDEVEEIFANADGLVVEEHGVMTDSVDNVFQAAYLSVLTKEQGDGQ